MDFDFNIILVPVTLALGLIWLLDKLWFKYHQSDNKQTAEIKAAQAHLLSQKENFAKILASNEIKYQDIDTVVLNDISAEVRQAQTNYRDAKRSASVVATTQVAKKEPFLVRMAYDFFPVLAVVLIVRSFIIEPFNIPSSSMVPTLYTGDFIAVNKYAYGIRLPLTYNKILGSGTPKHGDVVVFRYPDNPKINYIKRVIGLPGDTVSFANGKLSLNGELIPSTKVDFSVDNELTNQLYTPVKSIEADREWELSPEQAVLLAQTEEQGATYYQETLGQHTYLRRYLADDMQFKKQSKFLDTIIEHESQWSVQVPKAQYFVMGDNTDRSEDGRFWGFVSDDNLAGKAFYIWMHKKPGLNMPTFKRNSSID